MCYVFIRLEVRCINSFFICVPVQRCEIIIYYMLLKSSGQRRSLTLMIVGFIAKSLYCNVHAMRNAYCEGFLVEEE